MSDHFFKSLKIENFRGIESLEIEGLSRVNLFVGKNNCGKTTVLESAFLLSGISNPELIFGINGLRGLTTAPISVIRDYFYNHKNPARLCISAESATWKRELDIKPFYKEQLQEIMKFVTISENDGDKSVSKSINPISNPDPEPVGVKYNARVSGRSIPETEFEVAVDIDPQGQPRRIPIRLIEENYIEIIPGRFNTVRIPYGVEVVDRALNNKKKGLILNALRVIESSIQDIRVGTEQIVSVDIGLDSFIPINLSGDGMGQIVKLVSEIISVPKGIYMVDEIGNGLHVSAVRDMWKIILNQSKENDTQIFATTHSKDVVESLQEMLENEEIEEGAISTYLLDKSTKGGVKAYKRSPEQMVRAVEVGIDIRS